MIRDPEFSAMILLTHYSFDLQGSNIKNLTNHWLYVYPKKWVIAAILEALYQGRYKAGSVSRILDSWQSKGYPVAHFDHDFADIAYKKLMRSIVVMDQFKHVLSNQEEHIMKKQTQKQETRPRNKAEESQKPADIASVDSDSKNIPNPGIREWARLTQRLVS